MTLGPERPSLRDRAAGALESSGLGWLLRRARAWRGLLVLNYHQVADRPQDLADPSLWSATQEQLDTHLRFLTRELEAVGPEALAGGPGRSARVMITFDDGYRDNHDLALPVLRAHGVTAVFFVTTGFIDRPRLPWWGEITALLAATQRRSLRLAGACEEIALDGSRAALEAVRAAYEAAAPDSKDGFLDALAASLEVRRRDEPAERLWMTWDMVRALRDAGMSIGGHTVNHPRLSDLEATAQAGEVEGGLQRLEEELGQRPQLFSYPYGGRDAFDTRTVGVLREAGIRFAFSYYGGHNHAACWDAYDLRRASASASATPARRRAAATLPRLFARW